MSKLCANSYLYHLKNKVLKCVLSLNEQTKSRLSERLTRLNSLVKWEMKVRFLSHSTKINNMIITVKVNNIQQ